MERALVATAMVITVSGATNNPQPPSQVHLSLDPASAAGGADWAPVVSWRSSAPSGDAVVIFGRAPTQLTQNATAEVYTTHPGMGNASFPFATLRGLTPDTTYFYRVGSPSVGGFSPVHNLTTPPVSGAKPTPAWSFLAYGDLGTPESVHEAKLGQDVRCTTNTTVNADPPGCPDVTLRQLHRREWDGARPGLRHELVLHVGDIVYGDWGINLTTNVAWWDSFGNEIEFLAASKPYLICPGNHDLHGRTGVPPHHAPTGDLESLRYNSRYRMPSRVGPSTVANGTTALPVPGPERYYYAFSHRNIRFVAVSTEHSLSPGSAQYAWLESELAAADSAGGRAKQPWLVLFGHKPPVCSHADTCGAAQKLPLELLSKYHVDLALWGHLHAYERTWPLVNDTLARTGASYHNAQGTPHVVIGMAGAGFCCGGWSAVPPMWSAFREDSFGYSRIHVESDHVLHFEYVRNGAGGNGVRDNFTITKDNIHSGEVWRTMSERDRPHINLPSPHSDLGYRSCPETRSIY